MAHTPGPWKQIEYSCTIGDKYDNAICDLRNWYRDESEGTANARLICASPEMLEALERIFAAYVVDGHGNRELAMAHAIGEAAKAVHKAKGE